MLAARVPAPAAPSEGKAEPEPDSIIDVIKKPEAWGTALTGAGGLLAALANNPILSAALAVLIVAAGGLVIFHFYQQMRKADPA